MLHITEFNSLLLQLLPVHLHLLSLGIEFALHLVQVGIETSDRVLQVNDFLVFGQEVSFVVGNVVLQDGFVADFALLLLSSSLQTFDELFFVLV
jgi:hypothetical protein